MKAQGLYHVAGTLLKCPRKIRKGVRREEPAAVLQALYIGDALPQLRLRHIVPGGIFFQQLLYDRIGTVVLKQGNHVVGHIVHYMNAAGACVQHDIIAV